MNYYEHHLGDYMRDTAHLSMLEDAAYRRLLDAYYVRERPLPADVRECCKLARAASKPERDAVAYVLREFFSTDADGFHQARADAEIARFQDKQRKAKASADARWSHTERNANASANASANAQPDAMRTHSEGNAIRATRADTGARPSPDSSHQTPPTDSKNPRVGRGSRLPPDWAPDLESMVFAVGLLNGRCESELAKFRDYWAAQPGQKGVKTDWTATWRNWARRAAESAPKSHQPDPFEVAR